MDRKKVSKKTIALLVAAGVLLAGGVSGTVASLVAVSDEYTAEFHMKHMQVHLIENGEDVCGGKNTPDGSAKVSGALATELGYKKEDDAEILGKVEPGKVYKEEICARNGQDVDEFIRMTIRKYWVKTDEEGNIVRENGGPVKDTVLSPDLIRLTYGKDDPDKKASDEYNTEDWQINEKESTAESTTYYCTKAVAPGNDSALLFDRLMISGKVAELGSVNKEEKDGVTVYTYEYTYDGYTFFIEADVQAVQTHNAEDAIHSQWGVYDVSADESSGTLSVDR